KGSTQDRTHQFPLCRFLFSSRRRQTRFSRDWSSDVCSSDLPWEPGTPPPRPWRALPPRGRASPVPGPPPSHAAPPPWPGRSVYRSEERRVGKECESDGSPAQQASDPETSLENGVHSAP